jgi:hypothetical protein
MKKIFLIATMALGTGNVFASSQPIQKSPVKKSADPKLQFCCTVMISNGEETGQSSACSNQSHDDACNKAYAKAKKQIHF